MDSYKVINDNKEASYNVVKSLINQGYKKIAFIGGPEHQTIFKNRKEGYLKAIKEAGLIIPYNYIVDNVLYAKKASEAITELLNLKEPPDAFFTVSDHQSLEVFKIAESMNIKIPEQLGIFGFANEDFGEIIKPTLSSVDQKSKELGKHAANLYFKNMLKKNDELPADKKEIINSEIIIRQSSLRS